jgi:hypothetical protein
MYNYLKTPTSICIWTNNKTYLIGVDDPKYMDIINAIDKDTYNSTNDWTYLAAFVDPELYELESELEDEDSELD